jgi:hypothetical protein
MKTNHEIGAQVIIAVRENADFARDAVEWLLSKQEDDERMQGTSLHRNGEGLSKIHAARIDKELPADMSHDELKGIASAYSHTQLAEAVEAGELKLPPKKKRRVLCPESDDELFHVDDDEEQDQDDDEDDAVVVDRFGIHLGPLCMPSRALCARVGTVVERLRAAGAWTPNDVKNVIMEESKWLLGHAEIDDCVIDAALYYALPAVTFSPADPPRRLIRLWWNSESMWANARVDRVSVTNGELRVDMTFPEEKASGFITGADTLYAYALA